MKAKSYFFLTLSLLILSFCFEDIADVKRRLNFYKNIEKFSNNTLTVGYDSESGLYCVANEDILAGSKNLKVPKRFSLSPYYLYPFKFEFFNALNSIPQISQSIGTEQKFGVYMLTFYVLYILKADKKLIRQYIIDNNITEYMNCEEVEESIVDSFPKILVGSSTLDSDQIKIIKELGYPFDKDYELELVMKTVFDHIKIYSPHVEYIISWINNFDEFKYAYGIVMSRGMTLMMNEYKILEGINPANLTGTDKKNYETNNYFAKTVGAPCIINYVDLCNHYQPIYNDMRDKHSIILDTEKGYFINSPQVDYKAGEEVTYTYSNEPTNIVLFIHYGFIIPKNRFNKFQTRIEDSTVLNINQFNLCRELGCLDSTIKDPLKVPKVKVFGVQYKRMSSDLLNYARVRFLKGEINHKKIMRSLSNDRIISYDNEIKSWAYYFHHMKFSSINAMSVEKIIQSIQKNRNKVKNIEKEVLAGDKENLKLWKRFKNFELIYSLDLSYRSVLTFNRVLSINNLIKNINGNINDLKMKKYLKNK